MYNSMESKLLKTILHAGFFRICVGVFVILVLLFLVLSSNWYEDSVYSSRNSPYDFTYQNMAPLSEVTDPQKETKIMTDLFQIPQEIQPADKYKPILGTTGRGKDVLLEIMYGSQTTLFWSFLAVTISLILGVVLGIGASYYENFKNFSLFIIENIESWPKLIVLIVIVSIFSFQMSVIMITLGILNASKIAGIIKNKVLELKKKSFIDSVKELGLKNYVIIFKHILWKNCKIIFLIQFSYEIAEIILLETTLNFVDWGTKNNTSWGSLIYEGWRYSEGYWSVFFPALVVVISLAGFMLLSDGLGDWFRKEFNS